MKACTRTIFPSFIVITWNTVRLTVAPLDRPLALTSRHTTPVTALYDFDRIEAPLLPGIGLRADVGHHRVDAACTPAPGSSGALTHSISATRDRASFAVQRAVDGLRALEIHSLHGANMPRNTMGACRRSSSTRPTRRRRPAQGDRRLAEGIEAGERFQTLLGVTGSGKTATMGFVIEQVQKPTLVLAHNKTLAAQLCSEFREFFPDNAVEYFVSYYDYYQPEAYVPHQDLYIEKDSSINDEIDRLRHAATASLFAREDVIIVASVSCIYGIGSPDLYKEKMLLFKQGEWIDRDDTLRQLVSMQYVRNDANLARGNFRVRGEVLEVHPAYAESAYRDPAVRRRDRADPALRPAHRRDLPRPQPRVGVAGDPLRDLRGHHRALAVARCARSSRSACKWLAGERQGAGGAPPAPAHRVRHGDAQGDGLLLGHRELLADPRRAARRARRRTR